MDLKDELDFDISTFSYQNIGRSRHRGFEGGVTLEGPDGFTAFGNYTLQAPQSRSGDNAGNYPKAVPRHSYAAGVGLEVGEGGITRITAGEVDLATNAETQLLRESLTNPDLRIIMTVTESFYRLVGRRSAGIETLADLRGKRIMLPRRTSANYFLVAMLATVGLTEADVELVNIPAAADVKTSLDLMSDALLAGEVDVISIWEPEPEDAIRHLGDDAIAFQDHDVYREVFNLHATATALADPVQRRSIVAFVRAVADATAALQQNPAAYWPQIAGVIGYSEAQIADGWPEMEFPVQIVPDMLDVLETEEAWVATERDREPRSREELAQFIDYSVLEEALADSLSRPR
jgi:NitT/TauT family transport system substrate-binding protein